MNAMDRVKRKDEDYYSVLGCHDSATTEQILVEYKHKALLYHPDKNEGLSKEKFQMIQEAKYVLSDPEKRKDYDRWKSSGLTIPYSEWKNMRGSQAPVFHWKSSQSGRMLQDGHSSLGTPELETKGYHHNTWGRQETFRSILTKFRNYEI